jgi:thiamine kinase-like enzyme
MTEERILQWWTTHFEGQDLQSISTMGGSLSRNDLYLINDKMVLKIYNEVFNRFAKETKALKVLQKSDLAPQIIYKTRRDPVFGTNTVLMSFVEGCNLLHTFYLYDKQQQVEILKKIAKTIQALHQSKVKAEFKLPSYALTKDLENLLGKRRVLKYAPTEIIELARNKLKAIEPQIITGQGVFTHGDLHLGNFMVCGDQVKIIDFEFAKIDFAWRETTNLIKFFLVGSDDLIKQSEHLANVYAYGNLVESLKILAQHSPTVFDKQAKVWIEVLMLKQILGAFAHDPKDWMVTRYHAGAKFMFDILFQQDLLSQLLS